MAAMFFRTSYSIGEERKTDFEQNLQESRHVFPTSYSIGKERKTDFEQNPHNRALTSQHSITGWSDRKLGRKEARLRTEQGTPYATATQVA